MLTSSLLILLRVFSYSFGSEWYKLSSNSPSYKASPLKNSLDFKSNKPMEPGECPGKCKILNARLPKSITSPSSK